jgi:hypothetical protein
MLPMTNRVRECSEDKDMIEVTIPKREEEVVDLVEVDLVEVDLAEVDLAEVDLAEVDLAEVVMAAQ